MRENCRFLFGFENHRLCRWRYPIKSFSFKHRAKRVENNNAVCSAENGQKNNGHTIQRDCVTVFISVVLPTLLRQLLIGAVRGWQPARPPSGRSARGTASRTRSRGRSGGRTPPRTGRRRAHRRYRYEASD